MSARRHRRRHPRLETMARWLDGDLDAETVHEEILTHLAACCPGCSRNVAQLERLLREAGHWNRQAAVSEGRRAPGLWKQLAPLAQSERERAIAEDGRFHTWALCRLLERTSLETAASDAAAALELAMLARQLCRRLAKRVYDRGCLAGLEAECCACVANARREQGALEDAQADFATAWSLHQASGMGSPRVEGLLCSLEGALRRDQGRFEQAALLFDRAYRIYTGPGARDRDPYLALSHPDLAAARVLEARTACLREMKRATTSRGRAPRAAPRRRTARSSPSPSGASCAG